MNITPWLEHLDNPFILTAFIVSSLVVVILALSQFDIGKALVQGIINLLTQWIKKKPSHPTHITQTISGTSGIAIQAVRDANINQTAQNASSPLAEAAPNTSQTVVQTIENSQDVATQSGRNSNVHMQ